ncbi:F-box only protein 21-like isoform X3 [Portunus trituberculatus]|uniref:F-box only protein 21-like isoform X3 n=1 Tax=Portunus trituberculatus TaxID=210409 RepID=UPI001E1CD0BE|nr:F-box only protein 21-like isoform X3 [Portunus trituberculatus]
METSDAVTLEDLPDELLLSVLSCNSISVWDICRVACTCSRLRNIASTQNLWRQKVQHWPKIWDYLPSSSGITDWQDEVKQILCLDREVKKLVSGLSRRLYQNSHLTTPVYNEVDVMVMSTPYAPLYMKNALRNIIEDGPTHPRKPVALDANQAERQPRPTPPRPNWQRVLPLPGPRTASQRYENLTEKYYALKVMSHVHQGMCQREWHDFLEQPPAKQCLEVGTMLLARWFQPHTDVSIKQMKFAGNSDDYYSLKNSLINEVLSSRKGIPITLSIVYMAVCHRLGIRLEPVNFPSHFLVRWKIPGTTQYKFIDAFDKGRHFTPKEVLAEVPLLINEDERLLSACGPLQVFQRMIRNIMNVAQMQANISDHMELYCPATELMSLLMPSDHSVQELLLRIYYTLEIHYDRIVAGCQQLLKQNPSTILEEMLSDCQQIIKSESDMPKPIIPNSRSTEIAFATGLVMQHKRYNYSCVIFGWDKECKMPADWVRRMGVDHLQYKTKQPFYNVLVHDGSHRYAAQENLSISQEPVPISHSDIGKYFKEFNGVCYLPNDELQQQYPDDATVKNNLLREQGFF